MIHCNFFIRTFYRVAYDFAEVLGFTEEVEDSEKTLKWHVRGTVVGF
jgi:hypothetical protein